MRRRALKCKVLAAVLAVVFAAQPAWAAILSIPFFSQLDPRWSNRTICCTVSMAMALAYRGAPVDPARLIAWLKKSKGYSGDHDSAPVNWNVAVNYNGTHWLNYQGQSTLPNLQTLKHDIDNGKIIISMSKRFAIHWVIIRGVSADGTKGYYWDPWDNVPTTRLIGDGWVNPGISTRVFTVP
jgi:uncharacterized protein YvpB